MSRRQPGGPDLDAYEVTVQLVAAWCALDDRGRVLVARYARRIANLQRGRSEARRAGAKR